MMNDPHILFNKSLEQLRRLGARGGKAYGRNHRARRLLMPTPPVTPPRVAPPETTAEAIAVLDAKFGWLRGAESSRKESKTRRFPLRSRWFRVINTMTANRSRRTK